MEQTIHVDSLWRPDNHLSHYVFTHPSSSIIGTIFTKRFATSITSLNMEDQTDHRTYPEFQRSANEASVIEEQSGKIKRVAFMNYEIITFFHQLTDCRH
jgi:hypothetical protein